ncbi:MAG: peptidylprolyl isomerase [Endomicrobium sp.]|jgi:parvulin-like peptidyl-prolyl isomerase|nr:peptidylprolyl isomerase [Endomicrobium sp.]
MGRMFFIILALVFAFTLNSCNSRNSHIIAKIGGIRITETILNEKLASIAPEYQNYINKPSFRKRFIDGIVGEYVVLESAKKSDIYKKREYKNAVKEFILSQKKQLVEYKKNLLISMYIKEIRKNIQPNEENIRTYYNKHKELFDKPIEYTMRHILVSDLKTANSAYERIQKGENFTKVAKEISKDNNTTSNGNIVGPFKKGELIPEIEEVIFNLKNNEISKIIETPYGYHIVFKISENRLQSIPFEQAKEIIKTTLEGKNFSIWLTNEKQKFKVKINY